MLLGNYCLYDLVLLALLKSSRIYAQRINCSFLHELILEEKLVEETTNGLIMKIIKLFLF